MSEELKPCPKCGFDSAQTFATKSFGYITMCGCLCGMKGHRCLTWDDSIKSWNKRVERYMIEEKRGMK